MCTSGVQVRVLASTSTKRSSVTAVKFSVLAIATGESSKKEARFQSRIVADGI